MGRLSFCEDVLGTKVFEERCGAGRRYGAGMGTNRLTFRIASVTTLIALFGVAVAQQGPPPKEMLLGQRVFTAFRKDVRTELKITDSQFQRMQDAFDGAVQVDGDSIRVQLTGDKDLPEMSKDCMKVLDEGQRKRLDEIWLQRVGAVGVLDEKVGKEVGVTKEQLSKIDAIAEKAGSELLDLMMSGSHDESDMKKAAKIREDASKSVEVLLTKEQKEKLESLKGKPFALKKNGG